MTEQAPRPECDIPVKPIQADSDPVHAASGLRFAARGRHGHATSSPVTTPASPRRASSARTFVTRLKSEPAITFSVGPWPLTARDWL